MHRGVRTSRGPPPGPTGLTGQYRRPGELWACYDLIGELPPYTTSRDLSGGNTVCVKVSNLAVAAKLAYYAARTLSVLAEIGPPPHP